MIEIKGAITRPTPIPMRIDATNINADVFRNMNPTPIPISGVPPMTHVLLSAFLFRITSYNVCYTKLLRGRRGHTGRGFRQRGRRLFSPDRVQHEGEYTKSDGKIFVAEAVI